MPFYSRHSSDGRDRFLGDIQDEEEYDQFMKMIFISSNFSNFTDEIQSHYDSSDADVLPPSSSEEEKIEKTSVHVCQFQCGSKKKENCIVVSTTRFICLVKYENEVRHVDDLTSMKYSPVAMVALAPPKKRNQA